MTTQHTSNYDTKHISPRYYSVRTTDGKVVALTALYYRGALVQFNKFPGAVSLHTSAIADGLNVPLATR